MKMESKKRAVDKIFKRRNRYEIPEYQREEVWGNSDKQKLIDSMLRGWKLPKFYFLKTSDSDFEVVDGQQRLSAIFEFLEGDLELSETAAALFGGSTYDDLDEDVSDKFDDYEIDYDEIEDASEEEIQEFFQRLQGGFRLTSSEKLNAVPGKLTAFCRSLAKHDFFKNRVVLKNKRYAYFDIAAKAGAIELEGLEAGLRVDDLVATFQANKTFAASSKAASRLKAGLDFLHKALPADSPALRTRSMTQSIITLACKLSEAAIAEGREAKFAEFISKFASDLAKQVELGHRATDEDYLAFQRTVNANAKTGARTRHQILLRKLFQFDPSFAEGFDALAVSTSGSDQAIKKLRDRAVELIGDINDIYSAKEGNDLFKASNKTVQAQDIIGVVAHDYDSYKKLIEQMYFLFWEGPGSKLSEKPDSFKTVNTLRTELQHDVDHGQASKIAKKKKDIGAVFEKLSGVASPAAAHPERFPVVQLRLLSELVADLAMIKAGLSA